MGAKYDNLKQSHKQAVDAFLQTCVYADAARAAGSKAKNLSEAGKQLLRNTDVYEAYREMQQELADHLEITPERVLREYARIGFSDPRKLYKPDGEPIPVHELDADTAAAIGGIDVVVSSPNGEAQVTTKKIKIWDKKGALDSLAKHLGLFEKDNDQRRGEICKLSREELVRIASGK